MGAAPAVKKRKLIDTSMGAHAALISEASAEVKVHELKAELLLAKERHDYLIRIREGKVRQFANAHVYFAIMVLMKVPSISDSGLTPYFLQCLT